MAHSAKLYLEGPPLVVHEFHWGVVQATDVQTRPQNGVLAGKISLVIDKLQHALLDAWMADPRKQLSGELIAEARDGMGAARRLRFVDAVCINQGMTFTASGNSSFAGTMSVLISARELHIEETIAVANRWPDQ